VKFRGSRSKKIETHGQMEEFAMRLADAKAIADADKKGKYSVPELETALHRLRHAQGHLPPTRQKARKRSEGRIAGLETELAARRDAGAMTEAMT
jgi:hypothetical protein